MISGFVGGDVNNRVVLHKVDQDPVIIPLLRSQALSPHFKQGAAVIFSSYISNVEQSRVMRLRINVKSGSPINVAALES